VSGQLGRPREFDEDQVLMDIMSVFWKHGYEGTGVTQIVKATGLKKGSLYKAFKSKRNMYLKALAYYEKNVVGDAVKLLTSNNTPPLNRIKSFLSLPIEDSWGKNDWRGCFLCNAAADYAAHDNETKALVARGYGKLEHALMAAITDMHPDWSKDELEKTVQLCLTVYTGLRIKSRAAIERKHLEYARDACLDRLR